MSLFGSTKPKKVYVAAKPPGATSSRDKARVRLQDLRRVPPPRVLSVVALLLATAALLTLLPSFVTLWSPRAHEAQVQQHLARYRLGAGAEHPGLYRASPRRSDPTHDERATLYGVTTAPATAPNAADALASARALAAGATTLSAHSAWTQVQCRLGACPPECAARLSDAHYNATEGVWREAPHFAPTLRAQLDGLLALQACRGGALGPQDAPVLRAAAAWTRALVTSDGGYPAQAGMPASVMATYRAARLLQLAGDRNAEADADTVSWLALCAGLDGGFHDRPVALLERGAKWSVSPALPSLRALVALHALHPTAALTPSGVRFALRLLSSGNPNPSQLAELRVLGAALAAHPPSLSLSHPALQAACVAGALACLAAAVCSWIGVWPERTVTAVSALFLSAAVVHELGVPVLGPALMVGALALAVTHVIRVVAANGMNDDLLSISLASAGLSVGLLYLLGARNVDTYISSAPYLVTCALFPLAAGLSVYLATLLLGPRPLLFFTGAVFAGWLAALGTAALVLHQRGVLAPVTAIMGQRGSLVPVLVAAPLGALWLALGATHVALQ